jgi:hypothetical protein
MCFVSGLPAAAAPPTICRCRREATGQAASVSKARQRRAAGAGEGLCSDALPARSQGSIHRPPPAGRRTAAGAPRKKDSSWAFTLDTSCRGADLTPYTPAARPEPAAEADLSASRACQPQAPAARRQFSRSRRSAFEVGEPPLEGLGRPTFCNRQRSRGTHLPSSRWQRRTPVVPGGFTRLSDSSEPPPRGGGRKVVERCGRRLLPLDLMSAPTSS